MTELESVQNTQMAVWGNAERIQAIQNALACVPHNQVAVGIGFKLQHTPTNCVRCRAEISILELGGIIRHFEGLEEGDKDAA